MQFVRAPGLGVVQVWFVGWEGVEEVGIGPKPNEVLSFSRVD